MRKSPPVTLLPVSSLAIMLAVLVCIQYVDGNVAKRVWQFTSSQPHLHKHISIMHETVPTLATIIAIATALMWFGYAILFNTDKQNALTRFIKLSAVAVPTAFLIKMFLQYAFGRTYIRLWLQTGGPIEFRWFNPTESGGFPSGHMLVLTAFLTAGWLYYPRLRLLVATLLLVLAASLLFTSYHFVSDIIAGGYFGILITVAINHFFTQTHVKTN